MDLSRLFEPQSVAIVGASAKRMPGRYDFISWYKTAGYSGEIYPVNPNYQEVYGHKCYPSLNDIPGEIDLAIIMLPAEASVETLRNTAAGKVKFVFIIASGFGELGNENLENEMVSIAVLKGMRIIGPNCMGIYSRKGKTANAPGQTFGPGPGEIAMISQSGGNSANIVRTSTNSGVNVHSSVSIGNQCDLRIEDFLEWYGSDQDVRVIAGYVEAFREGRRFVDLAKKISMRKPIIFWKGGTTERGSHAASSHTGALAISNEIWNGVLAQTGIIPADHILEMIYLSRAVLWKPLPAGPGICLISPGGAHSVTMTDTAIREGLEVPLISRSAKNELEKIIAKVNTIIDNPIDVGAASYQPAPLQKTIEIISHEKNIHSFIFYHFINPMRNSPPRALGIEIVNAIGETTQKIKKPFYVALYAPFMNYQEAEEGKIEIIELLNKYRIPYTLDMESCVKMAGKLWRYSRYLQKRGHHK